MSQTSTADRYRLCENCVYWQQQDDGEGLCRAAAPRSHVVGEADDDLVIRAVWPSTRRDDWCGRWRNNDPRSAARPPAFDRSYWPRATPTRR